ncbi:ABC transporter permease subunit [Arthrobacter sp. B3I4]|uniref:ABC transporter permease subunit n=1 Tax=Arthrobacter sp. B3I4 TaxID=3042267 RepID=UPI002789A4FA|nr:ABC transporter permease subunit [Arthrobacter sp. B3I4]MDQ0754753.1 ABC-2 type transport system permease protein [Arthrobacter sp. B3I4]
MSSTTLEPTPSRRGAHAGTPHDRTGDGLSTGPGPSFPRVLNAEFIKFRTLLSTLILLASTIAVIVGVGALAAWGIGQALQSAGSDPRRSAALAAQGDIAASAPSAGISFAQLILGSLAVLIISSEFSTGMARSTFTAVPKRIPAFVAKLLVVVVSAFIVTAVSLYLAGLVAVPIFGQYGHTLDVSSAQYVRTLLINSAYVSAVAAIGLALGALLRNSAGGIMALVGIFFVLPIALQIIQGDFVKELRKYIPDNTLAPMTAAEHLPDTLEAWQAALVLGAWVVVPLVLAGVLLKKRDV